MAASAAPVNDRLHNQQQRIYQGVQSDSLTVREYQNLERRDDAITAQYYRDRLDGGGLTPAERWYLQRRLDQQSKRIYRNKHD
jgi:hypothetical protein